MRKLNLFSSFIIIGIFIFLLIFVHASLQKKANLPDLIEKRELVKGLELTDLCLFTEARYTRHLTQADLHTAFQDSPLSLEHFPSGSIFTPPEMIKAMNERVD